MANHVSGIDHVLIAVRDLDEAASRWRRLGFTLTPRGGHPEWGTANHCMMLAQGYLELIGVTGAGDKAAAILGFIEARGEGPQGLAFATGDGPAACRDLRAVGVEAGEPRSLSRPMATPEGTVRPVFSIIDLPAGATPGVASFLCQHVTPKLMRRPEWSTHANAAVGIASVTVVVEEPTAIAGQWERVFGPGSAVATDNTVAVHTGDGVVFLCRPDELTQLHPEADLDPAPAPPAIVAVSLFTADTDATAAVLDEQEVRFSRDGEGTIRVPPGEANGVFLEFIRTGRG